ncbi:hypothetical protein AAGW05_02730 [Arthrobacter sp. LAPM80]
MTKLSACPEMSQPVATLYGLIEATMEKALQGPAELSVVEYTVLDALKRQDGWHMRMQQLGRATELTPAGLELLEEARPVPEQAPLVQVLPQLHAVVPPPDSTQSGGEAKKTRPHGKFRGASLTE